jgi:hypothetical protein
MVARRERERARRYYQRREAMERLHYRLQSEPLAYHGSTDKFQMNYSGETGLASGPVDPRRQAPAGAAQSAPQRSARITELPSRKTAPKPAAQRPAAAGRNPAPSPAPADPSDIPSRTSTRAVPGGRAGTANAGAAAAGMTKTNAFDASAYDSADFGDTTQTGANTDSSTTAETAQSYGNLPALGYDGDRDGAADQGDYATGYDPRLGGENAAGTVAGGYGYASGRGGYDSYAQGGDEAEQGMADADAGDRRGYSTVEPANYVNHADASTGGTGYSRLSEPMADYSSSDAIDTGFEASNAAAGAGVAAAIATRSGNRYDADQAVADVPGSDMYSSRNRNAGRPVGTAALEARQKADRTPASPEARLNQALRRRG